MLPRQWRFILFTLIAFNFLLLFFASSFIWRAQSSLQDLSPQTIPLTPTHLLQPTKATISPTASPSTPSVTPIPTKTSSLSTSSPTPLPEHAEIISTSAGGRPILMYRFGTGKKERLIVAGIHGGNEYNTVLLAQQLIVYLNHYPQSIPLDKTLYILPNLNPDGFERSWDIYGRANDHGVDLNHNFPYRWAQDWDRSGCWHYLILSGGSSPASEPETQALMGFILNHHIQALISYHSAAMGIFPGGNPPFPPSLSLARAIAKVSDYPYPPFDSGCDYSGNLTDWAATLGIPAVDIELRNHRDTDFEQNLSILNLILHW